MAGPLIFDRVMETTTTTGTGTLTLAGAITGYQAWSAVGNGNTGPYSLWGVDGSGVPTGEWEVGIGTYTASGTTLARTKVIASSNSGSVVTLSAGTKRVALVYGSWAQLNPNAICNGRLTLESGVPVSTTDQLAKSTLYWTPYNGNRIALWNGSGWQEYAFAEVSLSLTLTSGKNYDVFLYDNSGTLTLELSAAWASDTTRTDSLALQDGVNCKSGALTRRWLGTIRASASNQTADSGGGTTTQVGGTRYVWNAYNQVARQLLVIDTTDTWAYTTNTIRQANAASGNKVEYVTGDIATLVTVQVCGVAFLHDNSSNAAKVGVGVDATTTFSGLVQGGYNHAVDSVYAAVNANYRGYPGLGYHFISWNEKGGDGTCSFLGDNGGDGQQTGLTATIFG